MQSGRHAVWQLQLVPRGDGANLGKSDLGVVGLELQCQNGTFLSSVHQTGGALAPEGKEDDSVAMDECFRRFAHHFICLAVFHTHPLWLLRDDYSSLGKKLVHSCQISIILNC